MDSLLHLDDSSHAQALASASVAASGGSDLCRRDLNRSTSGADQQLVNSSWM